MTDEQILKLRKRAIYIAKRHNREYLADDFAQEVTSIHAKLGQTLDQAWVDFMRREYGRSGYKRKHVELSKKIPALDTEESSFDFETVLSFLDTADRLIILLYYHEGYELAQIGYLFGVSESRISQRLTAVEKRIQETLCEETLSRRQRIQTEISQTAQTIPLKEVGEGSEILLEAFAEMAGL